MGGDEPRPLSIIFGEIRLEFENNKSDFAALLPGIRAGFFAFQ
jgi:hypothetical protein